MKRRTPETQESPMEMKNELKNERPSCIDVGAIIEKIRRDKLIRQQNATEQSEHLASDIQNWKTKNDEHLKELKGQMEVLENRKAQIRENMIEMNELANRLRERLAIMENAKNQGNDDEEAMQS